MAEIPTPSTFVEYVLPLVDDRATPNIVGRKGAALSRLAKAGLPVPAGFHVTTAAYRAFLSANGLQPWILLALEPLAATQASLVGADLITSMPPADPIALETASKAIERLFLQAKIPKAVITAVRKAYAGLGEDNVGEESIPVAVRSSATVEDLPDLSFAGQQETYLNITGGQGVLDALRRCWASLWTSRAIAYRRQHRIDPNTVELAVLVQKLVPAETAGVLFTANPLNGRRGEIVINSAWGLGQAVASGFVTPDTLIIEKTTGKILSRQVVYKAVMTSRSATGTVEEAVPEKLREACSLGDAAAVELARLGQKIEMLFEQPVDVEWARVNGQISILQSRPITALPEPMAESPTEWPMPDPKGKYVRSSIIELMPNPLTPLFGSVIPGVIGRGMNNLSRTMVGSEKIFPKDIFVLINDYGYYKINLSPSQMARLLIRIPVTLGRVLRTTEQRWRNQARPRYIAVIEHWRGKNLADLSAQDLQRAVTEILDAAIEHYGSIQTGILPVSYLTEVIFTTWYKRIVCKPGDPPALTFLLGFDSLPIRAEKSLFDLSRWVRAHPALAEYLVGTPSDKLASRLSGSAPANIEPEDWEGFRDRFQQHLLLFGHAIYDLDFASPVPADDPVPLFETLRRYLQGQGSDPFARQGAAAARREECEQRLQSRMHEPWRQIFLKLVGRAQKYAPLREDALSDVGLGWPEIRRMLLELGNRLAAARWIPKPADIFWLVEEEVSAGAVALDRGAAIPPALIGAGARAGERRARWLAEKQVVPPPVLPRKARWAGVDIEKFSPAGVGNPAVDILKGTPCSPGVTTAPACVLTGPEDFSKMQPGYILVAANTTPAWTPLFSLAGGLVTDIGGLLSHSSIVAREYGIPAVLGTGVATRHIRDGMKITVDGDRGIVQLSGDV